MSYMIDAGHMAMAANLADANAAAASWRRHAEALEAKVERLEKMVKDWRAVSNEWKEAAGLIEQRLFELQEKFSELQEVNAHNYKEAEKWAARAEELEEILRKQGLQEAEGIGLDARGEQTI